MRKPSDAKGFVAKYVYFSTWPTSMISNKRVRRSLLAIGAISNVVRAYRAYVKAVEETRQDLELRSTGVRYYPITKA